MNAQKLMALCKRYSFALLTVSIFAILFIVAVFFLLYEARTFSDQLIADDIIRIADAVKKIDNDCRIIGFDHQKNYVDFMTVKKFVGSEVSGMQLIRPDAWQGPYMYENPSVQGKSYNIVRTKKGFFLVPGDGVKLGNKKIIGIDIIFDESTDIEKLIGDGILQYNGKPLAAHLELEGIKGKQLLEAVDEED
jgi:hypothetical protein